LEIIDNQNNRQKIKVWKSQNVSWSLENIPNPFNIKFRDFIFKNIDFNKTENENY